MASSNGVLLLESRAFRPFRSSEEYLYAMKEDLAEWLQTLYPHLDISVDTFMERLETGVALCAHANAVRVAAGEYVRRKEERRQQQQMMSRSMGGSVAQAASLVDVPEVKYRRTAAAGTFFARDNLSNFIAWCRDSLRILECLLFESDDLIMRKNEKHVVLCLLEVARRGARFGMPAPMLVRMERQIDREIAATERCEEDDEEEEEEEEDDDEQPMMMIYGPLPQIVTNDLKSLDEMVRDLVERCTCATQFPMIRVSEGKYRIGDTKVLIFVRILRNHVMVRVGGGWDTLSHYLDKHDPCRCRTQHRPTQGARLLHHRVGGDLHGAHVIYDRSPPFSKTTPSTGKLALNRSRSPPPPTAAGDTTDHSDNASEVSDEGYRSLGVVVTGGGRPQSENERPPNGVQSDTENECGRRPPTKKSDVSTWSGRQRSRPTIAADTFARRSSTPRAQSVSPSKKKKKSVKGELRAILTATDASDDRLLIEVDRLLKQYNNMRVAADGGEQRSPRRTRGRRDSKPENGITRIPAPISSLRP